MTVVALLASCQQGDRHEPPTPAATPAQHAPAPDARLAPQRIVVEGLSVEVLESGEIQLRGKDRWGNPLDTTYENIQFLRAALPVLERSVSLAQAASLRSLVGSDSPHP